MMRVAVLGASGFVGSEVYRTLASSGDFEVTPFARSTGNSWDLLRMGVVPKRLNLIDAEATAAALRGYDGVVNCARPGREESAPALRSALGAAKAAGACRFVHISSVAIYGEVPSPAAVREDAPPTPTGIYGRLKLEQDELVAAAAKAGLSAITLCPPNITGPGSGWVSEVLGELRRGAFPLVDEGMTPVSTVDVGNLAYACARALLEGPGDGRRLFITDAGPITWADLIVALRAIPPGFPEPGAIDRATLATMRDGAAEKIPSFGRAMGRLASSDLRKVLAAEPWWMNLLGGAKKLVLSLPPQVQEPLKARLSSPASVPRRGRWQDIKIGAVAQQLRGVAHSNAAAETAIGYRPPYTFAQSMAAFARWEADMHPPEFALGLAA